MKFIPKELNETKDISKGDTSRKTFLKNVLSVVITLVLIYILLGIIADIAAATIPYEWESKMFSMPFEQATANTDSFQRAQKIFNRLVAHDGLRKLPYSLFYLDMKMPNAFATPGGRVGVTRGLLEDVTSDIGLAMVLGHELGHHQNRDCLKRLGRGILLGIAKRIFVPDEANSLVGSGLMFAQASYSRKQEKKADLFGLELVSSVYGHTDGALAFYRLIQTEYEKDRSKWTTFIASHPWTSDRIAYLEEYQRQLSENKKRGKK
jgi:Zn-dependent protease with chaperone function